jgi:hypothetical protein
LRDESKVVATPQLEPTDERAAPFHRLFDAVGAGADRLSLEVALAEAISAFAVISSAGPDHARPVRRPMPRDAGGRIAVQDLRLHAANPCVIY